MVDLLGAASTARPTDDGRLGFVEPAQIARKILAEREAIAQEWADALTVGTPALLQALLAADLEDSLAATDETDGTPDRASDV